MRLTKECPNFKPCSRVTLGGSHLTARNDEANDWKMLALSQLSDYGFTICGDGYKSGNKKLHNFILLTANGPVYLGMSEGAGGSGGAVYSEFKAVIDELDAEIGGAVVLGITDTPSANRKAWKLLMAEYPRQFWIGCMAHEISLYMKDVAKLKFSNRLRLCCLKLRNWVMNHASILDVFKEKVAEYYTEKRNNAETEAERRSCTMRMKSVLYKPGDTRMLSVFKMLFRTFVLREPIQAMLTSPAYKRAAQAAMATYNSQTKTGKKYKKVIELSLVTIQLTYALSQRGRGADFVDPLADAFNSESTWKDIEMWLQANLTIVYFHRIVDTHAPSLGMVYYCSCLVDKHLRTLCELDENAAWLHSMKDKFTTRWARWHAPIHTAAYHANPMFQTHRISDNEEDDCRITFERLWPDEADDLLAGLMEFKRSATVLTKQQWDKAQEMAPHKWLGVNKSRFPVSMRPFLKTAMQLTAQPSSASAPEQGVVGWSKVGCIETPKRMNLQTHKTDSLVNVNGWDWATEQVNKPKKRPDNMKLFDALDEICFSTQGRKGGHP